jgi:FKBP-type peptidyl-prolyl cis-trans isomerase 2
MVKNGDTIQVHYKGTLTDGTLFDSSEGSEPLEFKVGGGMVIPGFDQGVIGMAIGDKKTIHIPCDQAYGQLNDEAKITLPRSEVPEDMKPEIGMEMHLTDENGQVIPVLVIGLTDESITLDANHPLAGEDLNFDLELVSIS